jgi:antitoxin PrlF
MILATVTSKGQVTIPIEVRELLKIKAGDQIVFEQLESGGFVVKPAQFVPASIMKGMFSNTGKSLTIEEMNSVIAKRGASAKWSE